MPTGEPSAGEVYTKLLDDLTQVGRGDLARAIEGAVARGVIRMQPEGRDSGTRFVQPPTEHERLVIALQWLIAHADRPLMEDRARVILECESLAWIPEQPEPGQDSRGTSQSTESTPAENPIDLTRLRAALHEVVKILNGLKLRRPETV